MGAEQWFAGLSSIHLDMVDLMGRGYIIDFCISQINRKKELENFQIYVTDALASLLSRYTKDKIPRFYDMMHPAKVDTRSGMEIAEDIIAKHGLKVVN